jgi:hypothetical protein
MLVKADMIIVGLQPARNIFAHPKISGTQLQMRLTATIMPVPLAVSGKHSRYSA